MIDDNRCWFERFNCMPDVKGRYSKLDMFVRGCCSAGFLLWFMKLAIDERFWYAAWCLLCFLASIHVVWNCPNEPRQLKEIKDDG